MKEEVPTTYGLPALGEGLPQKVLRPRTVEEVSEALRAAWEERASVRPWGGGTHMALGAPILPAPVSVLELTGLHAVMEHRPEDMTITVQAGLRWGDLQARLAEAGHELPFDPPAAPGATVGGITAVGLSGPRRFAYGRLRDWVLGVQVVRPDGTVTRAGGRVVKNVSGYELAKVYAGSLGTLGVLTEVTFKTRPISPSRRVAGVRLPGFAALEAVLSKIMASPLEPAFLEAFWTNLGSDGGPEGEGQAHGGLAAAKGLASQLEAGRGERAAGLPWLLVGFEGTERRTAWQMEALGQLLDRLRRAADAVSGQASEGAAALRPAAGELLQALPVPWEGVHAALLRGHRIPPPAWHEEATFSVSLESGQVADYLAAVDRVTERHALRAAAFAHAGSGGMTLRAAGTPEALAAAGRALRARAEELGGTLVLQHGPPAVREQMPVWGTAPAALPLMQALKLKLDPRRILNPGRFVGGL